MKQFIFIAAIIGLFVACMPPQLIYIEASPQPSPNAPQITPSPETTPVPTIIPAPAGLTGPVKAVFYKDGTVSFWDGQNFVDWKSGGAVYVPDYGIAVDKMLYRLDDSGAVISQMILPVKPIGLVIRPVIGASAASGNIASRSISSTDALGDIWIFEHMAAEIAAEMGYPPAPHTRIWKNDSEWPWDGAWLGTRPYDTSWTASNGDVLWRDVDGQVVDLTTPRPVILWYIPGGPIWWQSTSTENGFTVSNEDGNFTVTSAAPYFSTARTTRWWQHGDVWYSSAGQSWSEADGYDKHATGLYDFTWNPYPDSTDFLGLSNAVPPQILYLGSWNGLDYLLECCSGYLVILDPVTGNYIPGMRLYNGVTTNNDEGARLIRSMKPQQSGAHVYLHKNGTLWDLDLSTMMFSAFSQDQVMWVVQ